MLLITYVIVSLLVVMSVGSLLALSNNAHWFIRGWDFPHVQMAILTVVTCLVYFVCAKWIFVEESIDVVWHWIVAGLSLFLLSRLLYGILPYTPLLRPQTKLAVSTNNDHRVSLVISNVEMENDQYNKWMQTIASVDPDITVVLEVNELWLQAITPLRRKYANEVAYPQDNWYGILLLSRLPILNYKVRHRVADDVPSIDAVVQLPSGDEVRIIAVHPRPPEPIRDNHSDQRDAELILYGRELEHEKGPAIICGDLNDVAWSGTTRLFLRLSQMLDPRRGRGFFNSFNAKFWWMRFPLDHVFHSRHFTLHKIERLADVGSDHFPMCIELQFEPDRKPEQEPLEQKETDKAEAQEIIARV